MTQTELTQTEMNQTEMDRTELPAELAVTSADDAPDPAGRLLQRVIMPRAADPMRVRSLYLDERTGIRLSTTPADPYGPTVPTVHLTGSAVSARRLQTTSRTSAVISAQSEVSFGAYFNAFAAGYWRHWSRLTEVHLRLSLEGAGRIDIYRTKADGSHIFVCGEVFAGGHRDLDVELDLRPFEDGGWYWFDLTTDVGELTLHGGGWYAAEDGTGRSAVTIGMPTFNRPVDCVATLVAIGEEPLVLDAVTAVIIARPGHEEGARRARLRRRRPRCSATSCGSSTSRTSADPAGTPA